ncbi:MAG: aminoacyl-tRNA hydrolase [Planctomycetes bacterium]|nr:aminoacyl-tRNA hydrolase [Planctomycetota bacterium]
MAEQLRINAQLAIPRRELRFTFVRSSGPGGQNVNKVASKAVLRWSVTSSASIPEDVRGRLLARAARQINDRGELVLTSQRYRDQARNIDDCLEKLRQLILAATKKPRPRKKTRPTKAAKEARLGAKRAMAEKKRRRTPPSADQ